MVKYFLAVGRIKVRAAVRFGSVAKQHFDSVAPIGVVLPLFASGYAQAVASALLRQVCERSTAGDLWRELSS